MTERTRSPLARTWAALNDVIAAEAIDVDSGVATIESAGLTLAEGLALKLHLIAALEGRTDDEMWHQILAELDTECMLGCCAPEVAL